jgi:hypothetical protein
MATFQSQGIPVEKGSVGKAQGWRREVMESAEERYIVKVSAGITSKHPWRKPSKHSKHADFCMS